jgi:hypothetical protein
MPKKNKRQPVVVVSAPSAFPDFSSFDTAGTRSLKAKKREVGLEASSAKKGIQIDFDDTVREIHQLGSTQFTGKQKKQFEAEQYKALTGREKKKQKVPVKIVRGIKKAAAKREANMLKQLKESGVVTAAKSAKEKKSYSEKNRRDSRIHGPAPSAGFMSKGMLRVKRK